MGDSLIEIIGGLILFILSGLGFYTRKAHTRIDNVNNALEKSVKDLDRRKANTEDVTEIKSDIKTIIHELKKFQVENARWQGQMEGRGSSKPEKS